MFLFSILRDFWWVYAWVYAWERERKVATKVKKQSRSQSAIMATDLALTYRATLKNILSNSTNSKQIMFQTCKCDTSYKQTPTSRTPRHAIFGYDVIVIRLRSVNTVKRRRMNPRLTWFSQRTSLKTRLLSLLYFLIFRYLILTQTHWPLTLSLSLHTLIYRHTSTYNILMIRSDTFYLRHYRSTNNEFPTLRLWFLLDSNINHVWTSPVWRDRTICYWRSCVTAFRFFILRLWVWIHMYITTWYHIVTGDPTPW